MSYFRKLSGHSGFKSRMVRFGGQLLKGGLCVAALAGVVDARPPVAADDLTSLSDEFNQDSLSSEWTMFHEAFGWPNKLKKLDTNASVAGALHLQAYHSAWVRDLNAPFLFKTVKGDFDVRARVRVRGSAQAIPAGQWSLAGLMARVPNQLTAETWQPRMENWHFITTGVAHEPGKAVTETKGTYNSYSSLKIRPAQSGWLELRLVRVGMALFALARPDGNSPWVIRDRFYRMEASPSIQIGIVAYAASEAVPGGPDRPEKQNREVLKDAPVDASVDVDWIRFSRPKLSTKPDWYSQVSGANLLAEPGLSDADILSALGG